MNKLGTFASIAALLLLMAACEPQPQTEETAADTTEAMEETAMMEMPDTTGAAVWSYLQQANYQENWQTWPDKGELYEGQEPHGMLLTTYLNEAAYQALTGEAAMMPADAIIVKENYMPDSTLAAITVMYKVEGFNPDHNDWFFSKHLPSGDLDMAPNGMAMEGRVPEAICRRPPHMLPVPSGRRYRAPPFLWRRITPRSARSAWRGRGHRRRRPRRAPACRLRVGAGWRPSSRGARR